MTLVSTGSPGKHTSCNVFSRSYMSVEYEKNFKELSLPPINPIRFTNPMRKNASNMFACVVLNEHYIFVSSVPFIYESEKSKLPKLIAQDSSHSYCWS
jgi:hypothetical protein